MRIRFLILLLLISLFIPQFAFAEEYQAPSPPESAQKYMPEDTDSFFDGLWYILKQAIQEFQPNISESAVSCLKLIGIALLTSALTSANSSQKGIIEFAGILSIGVLILEPVGNLISLGAETMQELRNYGTLLLPVMTAAMAAQGGLSASASLYAGTTAFNAFLSNTTTILIIPGIYISLALAIADNALGMNTLTDIRKLIKGIIVWVLKIVLYVFTGYVAVSGVINGTADAYAIKATKIALSGSVPVVGGIISDASEAILVSAGLVKNSVGVYGLLAILSICVGPFLRIGIQYLMLQLTASLCSVFGSKRVVGMIRELGSATGILLAATGTLCLLLLISIVCFMKGVL